MFNIGQRTAVAGAFNLAGYVGSLMTLRVDDATERTFALSAADFAQLREIRTLEQVAQQVLGCKVWIVEDRGDFETVAFE